MKIVLKNSYSNNMKLQELKQLLKEHGIRGSSHLSKPELEALLVQRGILPCVTEKKTKSFDHKAHRKPPRRVEMEDLLTHDIVTYPTMYQAAKAFGVSTPTIAYYKDRVWKEKYHIKIYDADKTN